jgi:hypothetical protein
MFGARDDLLVERGSCAVGVGTFVFQGHDIGSPPRRSYCFGL